MTPVQRLRRIDPGNAYLMSCAAVLLLMVGQTFNHLWANLDFWVWLGPVREFATRPLHPHHPLLALNAPDSYMGPYSFGLGLVSRLTGASPFSVLTLSAFPNIVVVLTGLHFLARRASRHAWTPVLLLAFTLLAWGWQPWRWSGYPNLNSLGTVLPLGSTLAYGLALFFLGSLYDWLNIQSQRSLAISSACFAAMALTHHPTALWASLIAAGLITAKATTLGAAQWRSLVFAGAAATIPILVWPFYSTLSLASAIEEYGPGNNGTYQQVAVRSFLALPGIALIVAPVCRRNLHRFALPLAITSAVFVYGLVVGNGALGRVLPGIMLLAHLTMADHAAGWTEQAIPLSATRRTRIACLAAVLSLGLLGSAPGWLRSVPRAWIPNRLATTLRITSYVDPNLRFSYYFADSDVVASANGAALPIGAFAAKVISVDVPQPFVSGAGQRANDVATMLDPSTDDAIRSELLARYRPDFLVVRSDQALDLASRIASAVVVGEVNGFTVIRI